MDGFPPMHIRAAAIGIAIGYYIHTHTTHTHEDTKLEGEVLRNMGECI